MASFSNCAYNLTYMSNCPIFIWGVSPLHIQIKSTKSDLASPISAPQGKFQMFFRNSIINEVNALLFLTNSTHLHYNQWVKFSSSGQRK